VFLLLDWVIATPLILTELLLTAILLMNMILSSIFADTMMITGGLVVSKDKWAFYDLGCVAMFGIFWNLLWGMKSSEEIGGSKHRQLDLSLVDHLSHYL
jgi:bacteriorhodopsin